jgi:hypothetical protein
LKNDDNVRGQDSADHEHNAGAKTQPVDERTHEKPRLIVDPTARRGAKKMAIYSGEFHAYGDPPRGTFTRRRIRVLEQLEGAATAAQPQWQTKAIKRMHLGELDWLRVALFFWVGLWRFEKSNVTHRSSRPPTK